LNGLIQFTLFLMGKFNSKVEPPLGMDCVRLSRVHCIIYYECICSVRYLACHTQASYYTVICGLYHFCHISYMAQFSEKKLLHIKCVFRFSLKFIRNMPHSKKKSARYCLTCLHIKYLLFLSDFNET